MFGRLRTTFPLFFSFFILRCSAQVHTFGWKFGNNFILTELQECLILPITILPNSTSDNSMGVPPYYMLAFELGGVPTMMPLGADPNNMSWQVNHAQGSALMLAIVDSKGNTGGVSNALYNVTAGNSTSCIPANPPASSLASVHPNVTSTLTTCQPWGLTISGGKKPYQVVLSALNSPVITNVTMGPQDDVFTFPDRANPGTQIMASVVDASGQWGISTNTVQTTGSADISCIGWASSSKTSQQIAADNAARQASAALAARNRRRSLILGIVLGLSLPLLLAIAVGIWWSRRRNSAVTQGIWDGQDITPRIWDYRTNGNGNEMQEVEKRGKLSKAGAAQATSNANVTGSPTSTPLLAEEMPIPLMGLEQEPGSSSRRDPPHAHALAQESAAAARHRKALEARRGIAPTFRQPSGRAGDPNPSVSLATGSNTLSALAAASIDPDVQPDIIIQHRDGGVVHELPPPYADRSRASSS